MAVAVGRNDAMRLGDVEEAVVVRGERWALLALRDGDDQQRRSLSAEP